MAAETITGFTIDGRLYPMVGLADLDMNELEYLYDLAGVLQEDFVREEDEDEAAYLKRTTGIWKLPKFKRALLHFAYARGNPELSHEQVVAVIDRVKWAEAAVTLGFGEDEAVPLDTTPEPKPSSRSASSGSSGDTGAASGNGSGEQGSLPDPIGTGA